MKIGLSGGIGSGKSTVAAVFAELGAVIIDSDALARQVVEPGSDGLLQIVEKFGPHMLHPDGSLNREQLSSIVFNNPNARATLNAITHPLIAVRTQEIVEQAGEDAIIVHDTPLLTEVKMAPLFHLVIMVTADESLRLSRLVDVRNMNRSEAQARIGAQATMQQREQITDVWIDNSTTLARMRNQVFRLWFDRIIPYHHNIVHQQIPPQKYALSYDPLWDTKAQQIINRLWFILASIPNNQVCGIYHIGATAVPQYPANNIIDIMIVVDHDPNNNDLSYERDTYLHNWHPILAAAGFIFRAEWLEESCNEFPDILGSYASADPDKQAHIYIQSRHFETTRLISSFPKILIHNPELAYQYTALRSASITNYHEGKIRKNQWFEQNHDRFISWIDEHSLNHH